MLTGTLASSGKLPTMLPYDFLKLHPYLVCHVSWSTATLNQLLGTCGGKGAYKKLQPHHTHALTPPPEVKERKQTGA
jgi:hypothetical protein